MRVILQRCLNGSVEINNKINGKCNIGYVILVGFTHTDSDNIVDKMVNKIVNLRIFDDENGIMNKNIIDIKGSILSISQFTLYGDTSKGNRPSYFKALENKKAKVLYDLFNNKLNDKIITKVGKFGSEMDIELLNDGPVTIIIEKDDKNDN